MKSHRHLSDKSGFTILELMMVCALIAIIGALSMPFSLGSMSRAYTTSERDLYVALLISARGRSLANEGGEPHGVYIDTLNRQYFTYTGDRYSSDNASNVAIPMISDATLSGVLVDTVFAPLRAHALRDSGTTSISTHDITYEVVVNDVGRIEW
jgi:prepilin-type N-terminal cleavage/methylation domain-containing protein